MLKFAIVAALCGVSLGFVIREDSNSTEKLPTFAPDLSKYLGRWYQVYGNEISGADYDPYASCHTQTYGNFNDTAFTVYNSNNILGPEGIEISIEGKAWTTDKPGKLNLELVPYDGLPLPVRSYWIVKLGPKTFGDDGLYEYSVVTNEDNDALYVLVRDTEAFKGEMELEVLVYLRGSGFYDKRETRPKALYHGDNCEYP